MKCAKCSVMNPKNALFCLNCGSRLAAAAAAVGPDQPQTGYLEWLAGPQQGKRESLTSKEVYLGRDEHRCQIAINNDHISRCHSVIRQVAPGRFVIEDLSSCNGTFVNDALIHGPTLLRAGDRIRLGRDTGVAFAFGVEAVRPVSELGAWGEAEAELKETLVMEAAHGAQAGIKPSKRVVDKTVVDPQSGQLANLRRLQYVIEQYVATTLDLRPGTRIRVGRAPDNDLTIDDPTTSFYHAEILIQEVWNCSPH